MLQELNAGILRLKPIYVLADPTTYLLAKIVVAVSQVDDLAKAFWQLTGVRRVLGVNQMHKIGLGGFVVP